MNAAEMIKVAASSGQIVLTAKNPCHRLVLLATTWKTLVGVTDGSVQEIVIRSNSEEGLVAVAVTFTNGANTRILGAFIIPLTNKGGYVYANVTDVFVPSLLVQMVVDKTGQSLEIRTCRDVTLLPLSYDFDKKENVTVPVMTLELLLLLLREGQACPDYSI